MVWNMSIKYFGMFMVTVCSCLKWEIALPLVVVCTPFELSRWLLFKSWSSSGDDIIMHVQLQINDHRFEDAEEMEHEHESTGRH